MQRFGKIAAASLVVSAIATSLSACESSTEEFSNDPVLRKSAAKACETAQGMPNLGSNFNWKHQLSGDFDPTFRDEGTFDWAYLGERTARKTFTFSCSGRFDDSHAYAQAVLEDLSRSK